MIVPTKTAEISILWWGGNGVASFRNAYVFLHFLHSSTNIFPLDFLRVPQGLILSAKVGKFFRIQTICKGYGWIVNTFGHASFGSILTGDLVDDFPNTIREFHMLCQQVF